MLNDKYKHHLHLHFLVFIAGFTAILGKLITVSAYALVWYRMFIASLLLLVFIKAKYINLNIGKAAMFRFTAAGIVVALHWITFFEAINQSNISITLAMFSSGAFFAALIEPFFFKRKLVWYEIFFGVLIIFGVSLIVNAELKYINGIILGIVSALFSSLFAVLNGKFVAKHKAAVISFYEFISGVLFITIFMFFFGDGFTEINFNLSQFDFIYIFILASICTAYAFIASTHVMKHISPYTVVLSYNLEPVYGIILALIIFPESEKMTSNFYIGAFIVISVILLNALLKNSNKLKRKAT